MLPIGSGRATANLTLPNHPAFVGAEVFVQGGVWDFAQARAGTANPLGSRVGLP
jgi:hypothetical protein